MKIFIYTFYLGKKIDYVNFGPKKYDYMRTPFHRYSYKHEIIPTQLVFGFISGDPVYLLNADNTPPHYSTKTNFS